VELRTGPETQLEHREIASMIKLALMAKLPTVAAALGWETYSEDTKGGNGGDNEAPYPAG
jgi:thymidylate synthase ThyX